MTDLKAVEAIVRSVHPLLGGHPSAVQGAALADLLATWLAGHYSPGEPVETSALRERLLAQHLTFVRALIPINAAAIHGDEEP